MEPTHNQTASTQASEQTTQAIPEQNTANGNATPSGIEKNTLMGVLCYLGPLVIIPYLTTRNNSFVKFHIKQGIVLLAVEIIIYIVGTMFLFSGLYPLIMILNLGTFVLTIIGIINVVGKKEVPLPLIGQYAHQVKI